MAKRLSNIQKKEIIKGFLNGKSLKDLSEEFSYTKLTISRNLKKEFGDDEYENILFKKKTSKNKANALKEIAHKNIEISDNDQLFNENLTQENKNESIDENSSLQNSSFIEIIPLDLDIDNTSRKDISSIPIDEIDFPKIVFMIVDKKTELEIKLLKDYPEWQFLPEEDLKSKTIEIYSDLKDAKRDCKKEQKVIKVPNTNVFKIASRIIRSKGISRIISDKRLIKL